MRGSLRQQEQYKDLPIIAMTANAMKQDVEKVLEVGMNDHIAKPINTDTMFMTMAKWIKPGKLESEAKPEAKSINLEGDELPELYGVNVESSTIHKRKKLYKKSLIGFYDKQQHFLHLSARFLP